MINNNSITNENKRENNNNNIKYESYSQKLNKPFYIIIILSFVILLSLFLFINSFKNKLYIQQQEQHQQILYNSKQQQLFNEIVNIKNYSLSKSIRITLYRKNEVNNNNNYYKNNIYIKQQQDKEIKEQDIIKSKKNFVNLNNNCKDKIKDIVNYKKIVNDCVNNNKDSSDTSEIEEWQIKDLCFNCHFPTVYKDIAIALNQTRDSRQQYLNDFLDDLKAIDYGLRNIYAIEGRVKSIYSIYNKMQIKNLPTVAQVHDKYATRIITETEFDCYRVSAALRSYFKETGHKHDYIQNPKANGYRSIHFDVYSFDNQVIEIQIKSMTMHLLNEQNHCQYKGNCI